MPNEPYDTEELLRATADKLRSALDSIELNGSGEHEATVKHLARVGQALTGICAELRQHAKAKVRDLERIPLDQVITYLKTLPESVRHDLCREVSGADDQEPLL